MEETTWGDAEHKWVTPGQLFTRGPGTYKIPSFNDVPSDMRIKLMDRENAFAVHSSKVSARLVLSYGVIVLLAGRSSLARYRTRADPHHMPSNLTWNKRARPK